MWSILADAIAAGVDRIIATILGFAAVLTLAAGAVTLLFTLFFADIMIGIGLALGPFALALSVQGKFRGLVDNWLNFMLGACATKIVVSLIASIMITAMQSLTAIPANGFAMSKTGAMIGIIFLGAILALIAKDADKIATGIFGGISTARGPSGGQMMSLGKAAGGATAGAVGAAKGGADAIKSGASAAKEAFSNASKRGPSDPFTGAPGKKPSVASAALAALKAGGTAAKPGLSKAFKAAAGKK